MSFEIGINFRNTAGYVTDGTNETYCLAEAYPVTRGGATFGWENGPGGGADRSSFNERRLAGINFSNVTSHVFRIDLPSAGSYDVNVAAGDWRDNAGAGPDAGNRADWVLRDDATTFQTLSGFADANTFVDATNTRYSAANWPTSQTAVNRAFASTIFRAKVNASTANNCLAHIRIVSVEPAEIEATATIILEDATATAVGFSEIEAAATIILEDATASATGETIVEAAATIVLEDATATAVGFSEIEATATIILEDAIATATGEVEVEGITGTATIILEDATATAVGFSSIEAAATIILEDAIATATGETTVAGEATIVLEDATATAVGFSSIEGAATIILEDAIATATGTIPGTIIEGTEAVTLRRRFDAATLRARFDAVTLPR